MRFFRKLLFFTCLGLVFVASGIDCESRESKKSGAVEKKKKKKRSKDKKTVSRVLTDVCFERTDPKRIGDLYRLSQKFDALLTEHNIPYWICCGTLLGVVRHGGIVPWDDDVDVCIWAKDKEKVLKLEPDFKRFGMCLTQYPEQIIKLNFTKKGADHAAFVDIFCAEVDESTQPPEVRFVGPPSVSLFRRASNSNTNIYT